ncbi:unnamed protein product [Musa banksii]
MILWEQIKRKALNMHVIVPETKDNCQWSAWENSNFVLEITSCT